MTIRILIALLIINQIKLPPDEVPIFLWERMTVADAFATPFFIVTRFTDREVIDLLGSLNKSFISFIG